MEQATPIAVWLAQPPPILPLSSLVPREQNFIVIRPLIMNFQMHYLGFYSNIGPFQVVGHSLNDSMAQLYWQSCCPPCHMVLAVPATSCLTPTKEQPAVTSSIDAKRLKNQGQEEVQNDRTIPLCKKISETSDSKGISQNPKRNIITNIGNQLITFVSSRRKSEKTLRKLFPTWTSQDMENYYRFASRVKQSSEYYLNLEKIRRIWYCKSDCPKTAAQRKILRILSYHHLNYILPVSVMSSKKMKSQSKHFHLKAKRVMVAQLRNPHSRFTFI